MCGIIFYYSKLTPCNLDKFDRALTAVRHRGPDGAAIWHTQQKDVAIGHTRLAINDEEGGGQPMLSNDGRLAIAVNGEFYNKRGEINNHQHKFQTNSDSEFLLHQFAEQGVNGFEALDGEFSFVVWDQASASAYLGRDRHGIKPLYYCSYQGQILAASEIKALLAYGVPAKWNTGYLAQAEYFVQTPGETMVEGIYSVLPGHILKVSKEGVSSFPYLKQSPLQPHDVASWSGNFSQACHEFEHLLLQAIDKRLLKANSNQTYLSSGIDSSMITAMAAGLTASVNAYSIGFDDPGLDESKQAQQIAQQIGVNHEIVQVSDDMLADNLAGAVIHSEMPLPNLNVAAKLHLSKVLSYAGHKSVLTGEGADESLLGYGFFRQDLTQPYLHPDTFPLSWQADLQQLKSATGHLPAQLVHALPAGRLLTDLRKGEYHRPASFSYLSELAMGNDIGKINFSQKLHYQTVFQTYNLGALADRTEMANGIEGRPPFLDNALVAFIHQLPLSYKFDGKIDKKILREVAGKFLPPVYTKIEKKAFISAPASLKTKGPLAELFHSYLLEAEYLPEFYCKEKVSQLYLQALQMPLQRQASLDPVFMHLTSLMVLQKQFSLTL